MTNKKSTKRALLMSVLALLACVSMLVGSTFAWFTDSVTSGQNTIVSGNLDIELYNGLTTTASAVTGQTKLFDDVTLWEPGVVAFENLTIENKGNLALKYKMMVNFTNVTTFNGHSLSEALKVAVVNGGIDAATAADRTKVIEKVGSWQELASFTKNGTMTTAGGTETFAIVIYWEPTANDNVFNVQNNSTLTSADAPAIKLGINLVATQLTSESDSIDNTYDANARYGTPVSTYAELQAVMDNGGYAVLTKDITADNKQRVTIPEGTTAVIDLNGYTLTSMDAGDNNNSMAIYVSRKAQLTMEDSVGTGKLVASCYGVYVQPNATFIMNGGTISVSGNGLYDIGVTVWNGQFIMNGGAIEALYGVVADATRKNGNEAYGIAGDSSLPDSKIAIADGCTFDCTYTDVEIIYDAAASVTAPDSVLVARSADDYRDA